MELSIHNPYDGAFDLPWFKGQLHLHTDAHKGRAPLADMLAHLRAAGFDFAAISDHNIYTPSDAHSQPVLLGGAELRTNGGDILSLGADITDRLPDPDAPPETFPPPQWVIDQVRQAGGLPILAHPKIAEFTENDRNWTFTSEQINGLLGYAGVEIYTHFLRSGHQTAIDRLDALWIYRRDQRMTPVRVWGLASSDAHGAEDITPDVGILAAAPVCTPDQMMNAIAEGRFYSLADSPARFRRIEIAPGPQLVAVADGAALIRLYGMPQHEPEGDRRLLALAWSDGQDHVALRYDIRGTEGFLRLQAMDRAGGAIYANPLEFEWA